MNFIGLAIFCFLMATVVVRVISISRVSQHVLDIPNERSLHATPIPRTGGLGLLATAAIGWAVFASGQLIGLGALIVLLGVVTFADDKIGLSIRARLVAQLLAASVFLACYFHGHWWLLPVALGAIVWMANLYNFMDGSDGLAGGMTVIGFGAYALAAFFDNNEPLAMLSVALAGAAAGFLIWNFHRASVFMGDSGSVPLGFGAATLGILGWQEGVWPIWFPALVFSPFILDATVTLLKRLVRGDKVTQAHKTHYYQRALQMGLGHRGTAIAAYILMTATAASALLARDESLPYVVMMLVFWGGAFAILMAAIDRRWMAFVRDECVETLA